MLKLNSVLFAEKVEVQWYFEYKCFRENGWLQHKLMKYIFLVY